MTKLKQASSLRSKTSHTTSFSSREEKSEKPPKGAKIKNKTVRTETEQIENGWLLSKNYDVSWTDNKGNSQYSYYSEKFYSKENPIEVKVIDKALADEFEEE